MGKSKSTTLSPIASGFENKALNLFGVFYENFAPAIDQADLDSIHDTLRLPIKTIHQDILKLSKKYPLLKKIGAKRIAWLMLQAADVLHLGVSLFNHPKVSAQSKAKLSAALIYFIWPFDLIPEGIVGPIGYVDDVIVVIWVIDSILLGQDQKEKKLIPQLWRGSSRDLLTLRTYLTFFDVAKTLHTTLKQMKGR